MALVDIGAVALVDITATTKSTISYSNIDDNKIVKNFYPLKIGFVVQPDTLGIITTGVSTKQYIFWS